MGDGREVAWWWWIQLAGRCEQRDARCRDWNWKVETPPRHLTRPLLPAFVFFLSPHPLPAFFIHHHHNKKAQIHGCFLPSPSPSPSRLSHRPERSCPDPDYPPIFLLCHGDPTGLMPDSPPDDPRVFFWRKIGGNSGGVRVGAFGP